MALDNIVFSAGDDQNIVVQIPTGTLYAPKDIVSEPSSAAGRMVMQLTLVAGAAWDKTKFNTGFN